MTTTQKRRVQGTVRKEGGSFSLNMLLITTAGRVRLSCMKFWFLGHALANDTHRFSLKTTKVITAQISIFLFCYPRDDLSMDFNRQQGWFVIVNIATAFSANCTMLIIKEPSPFLKAGKWFKNHFFSILFFCIFQGPDRWLCKAVCDLWSSVIHLLYAAKKRSSWF